MSIDVFQRMNTRVILIGVAIQTNQCLVLAEIKRCHVRDWFVGE